MATPGEVANSVRACSGRRKPGHGRPGLPVNDELSRRKRRDSESLVLREDYELILVRLAAVDGEDPVSRLTLAWLYIAPAKRAAQYEASLV